MQNYSGPAANNAKQYNQFDDDIDEVIDEGLDNLNNDDFKDNDIATSGSVAGIDQSIDT